MSIIIQGNQLREISLGAGLITEPAKAPATGSIFTVVGGRVLITSLVATAIGGAVTVATSIAVATAPTSGVAQTLATATGSPTSLAQNGMWSVFAPSFGYNGTSDVFHTPPLAVGGFSMGDMGPVVPAGTINLTIVGAVTGTLKWDLTYLAFDDGAYVQAA
jgi:hypothetical protein